MFRYLSRPVISLRYLLATAFFHPRKPDVDSYFGAFDDVYRMDRNGPARVEAVAQAILEHVGTGVSLLDAGCHEGYALSYLADRLNAPFAVGIDLSSVALERAERRCVHLACTFREFDLNLLYGKIESSLPDGIPRCDVVIICDVLFYVGENAAYAWSHASRKVSEKRALISALQKHARRAVILQHFSTRYKDAIGEIVKGLGGRLVQDHWGIYILDGRAK